MVYLLLVFLALLGATICAALLRRKAPEARPCLAGAGLGLAVALATAAAVTWLESPWGVKALLLPFQFSSSEYFHAHLVEYRPPAFDLSIFPFFWSMVGASGLLLAVRTALLGRGFKERTFVELRDFAFELFLLGGFTFLALKHQRIVFPYAIVAAFVLTGWTQAVLSRFPAESRVALPGRIAVATGILVIGAAGLQLQFSNARFGPGVDHRYHPAALLNFVESQDLPGEAYVSDAWGGAWLWHFYPQKKVFYDNRLEAYSFEFYKFVYQSIRYGEEGWQDKLDGYDVNTLVLKYSTPGEREFQQGRPNIRDLAFASPHWSLVRWDELGQVFVRSHLLSRCALPEGCVELKHFNSDTLMPANGSTDRDVEQELRLVWGRFPNPLACYALARLLVVDGKKDEGAALLKDGLARYPDNPMLLQLAVGLAKAGR